jgi:hypothetical protein
MLLFIYFRCLIISSCLLNYQFHWFYSLPHSGMNCYFYCVYMVFNILSEPYQLTKRQVHSFFYCIITHLKCYTTIRCFIFHGTWENSCNIFRKRFIVIDYTLCIHYISLTIIKL